MDPYSRVEDLIEEGQPLHVGVEVVQLLHSDHLPAEKIIIKDHHQGSGSNSYSISAVKEFCLILSLKDNSSSSPVGRGVFMVRDFPDLHFPLDDLGHVLVHRRRVLSEEVDNLCFF